MYFPVQQVSLFQNNQPKANNNNKTQHERRGWGEFSIIIAKETIIIICPQKMETEGQQKSLCSGDFILVEQVFGLTKERTNKKLQLKDVISIVFLT